MYWYLAKISFHIICGDGNHTPQFDEQLRLLEAESELTALQKAKQTGEDEQVCFLNEKRKLVQWKFVGVTELKPLPVLLDGAEIYSRIQEADDGNEYITTIEAKTSDLLCEIMRKSFHQNSLYPMADSVEKCIGKIV